MVQATWDRHGTGMLLVPHDGDCECQPVMLWALLLRAQIVDRPTQGHVYLNRAYVQPQWAVDAANWRVLPDAALYAPGRAPPPHLSPFANVDDDDEGYVPDYARALQALQVRFRCCAGCAGSQDRGHRTQEMVRCTARWLC